MRIGICGMLGGGKNIIAVILGKYAKDNGMKVYSNFETTFGEKINPLELLKFELENCIVILDEAETIIDSRVNKRASRLLTYFFLQSRKRDVTIIWISQLLGAVDLRARFITEINILAEQHKHHFEFTIFMGANVVKKLKLPKSKAEQFYDMYDTTEIILPIELMTEDMMDFDVIVGYVNELPTKKSFTALMKNMIPFTSMDMISGAYDLIKVGKIKEAKIVLNYNE